MPRQNLGEDASSVGGMKPDLKAARSFLKEIDPAAKTFTLQTFDDNPERKDEKLARVLHLDDSFSAELLDLHKAGAGIFVTVNETDLQGRKSENITRIRDVWSDDDAAFEGDFPLEPSIVIRTSVGKLQYHWLLSDEWSVDHQGKADFEAVMERMVASYGCDPGAKGLPRVLRVPGFYHQKDPNNPQLVTRVGGCGKRYSRAEILAAFPPVERKTHTNGRTNGSWQSTDEDPERIRDALHHIPAHDRDVWVKIGMGLKDELGEAGFGLWLAWSQTAPEKFDAKDCRHKWESFKGKGVTIATLFGMARNAGWREEKRHQDAPKWKAQGQHWQTGSAAAQQWPKLGDDAKAGVAWEIATLATKNSEADPVAVLVTTLVRACAHFGRKPYFTIGDSWHHARLFAAVVGESSRARKGTSYDPVRRIFEAAERITHQGSTIPFPTGCKLQVTPGPLSTGEGIIYAIRDKVKGKKDGDEDIDPGVPDKRLFVIEAELGAALRACERKGNTLSSILRSSWDGNDLAPLIKTSRTAATSPHVCIVAHVTFAELRQLLSASDVWNSFANRFLWVASKRPKLEPFPKPMPADEVEAVARKLAEAIVTAHTTESLDMSEDAQAEWRVIYPKLTAEHPGILGAVTTRAEAQARRLAFTYALLDQSTTVTVAHLKAALALVSYAFQSAKLIFGDAENDPVAQAIIEALKTGPKTASEISALFHRNRTAAEINGVLASLQGRGRISLQPEKTEGRTRQVWVWVS